MKRFSFLRSAIGAFLVLWLPSMGLAQDERAEAEMARSAAPLPAVGTTLLVQDGRVLWGGQNLPPGTQLTVSVNGQVYVLQDGKLIPAKVEQGVLSAETLNDIAGGLEAQQKFQSQMLEYPV